MINYKFNIGDEVVINTKFSNVSTHAHRVGDKGIITGFGGTVTFVSYDVVVNGLSQIVNESELKLVSEDYKKPETSTNPKDLIGPKKVDGGGTRFNSGKLDLNYCPASTQIAVASVFALNSKKNGGKYEDRNWQRGQAFSIPLACAKRHFEDYLCGIDIDPDSGLPSLWLAQCNLAMLIEYTQTYPEGDDRPIKQGIATVNIKQMMKIYSDALVARQTKQEELANDKK